MGNCEVLVVEHSAGIIQRCKDCGKVIRNQGTFMVGLHIKEKNTEFKYMLGDIPQSHCGKEKHLIRCFDTHEEAEEEADKLIIHLSKTKSTNGLNLKKFFRQGIH